jgi:hypothetical protein
MWIAASAGSEYDTWDTQAFARQTEWSQTYFRNPRSNIQKSA